MPAATPAARRVPNRDAARYTGEPGEDAASSARRPPAPVSPVVTRFVLSLRSFWKVLADPDYAAKVEALDAPPPTGPDLRVLAILQRDGRLIDFLREDLDGYTDAQIGAAVRDIHRGCRKALDQYITLEPVLAGAEESEVRVDAGFDPGSIRLTGNVAGTPPFRGILKHPGWRVKAVQLPARVGAPAGGGDVIAPAEVQIP